jgi:hypothetical protein
VFKFAFRGDKIPLSIRKSSQIPYHFKKLHSPANIIEQTKLNSKSKLSDRKLGANSTRLNQTDIVIRKFEEIPFLIVVDVKIGDFNLYRT